MTRRCFHARAEPGCAGAIKGAEVGGQPNSFLFVVGVGPTAAVKLTQFRLNATTVNGLEICLKVRQMKSTWKWGGGGRGLGLRRVEIQGSSVSAWRVEIRGSGVSAWRDQVWGLGLEVHMHGGSRSEVQGWRCICVEGRGLGFRAGGAYAWRVEVKGAGLPMRTQSKSRLWGLASRQAGHGQGQWVVLSVGSWRGFQVLRTSSTRYQVRLEGWRCRSVLRCCGSWPPFSSLSPEGVAKRRPNATTHGEEFGVDIETCRVNPPPFCRANPPPFCRANPPPFCRVIASSHMGSK
eukprot:356998-Chlamydomonas_euryale.AAC.3